MHRLATPRLGVGVNPTGIQLQVPIDNLIDTLRVFRSGHSTSHIISLNSGLRPCSCQNLLHILGTLRHHSQWFTMPSMAAVFMAFIRDSSSIICSLSKPPYSVRPTLAPYDLSLQSKAERKSSEFHPARNSSGLQQSYLLCECALCAWLSSIYKLTGLRLRSHQSLQIAGTPRDTSCHLTWYCVRPPSISLHAAAREVG